MRLGDRHEREPAAAGHLSRRRFLAAGSIVAAGLPGLLAPDRASAATAVTPVVLAATTLDEGGGLLAAVRTSSPAQVSMQAWPLADPRAVRKTAWVSTNAARVAKLSLPGAGTDGQAWAWRSSVRDPLAPLEAPVKDVVRTIPASPPRGQASSFTFAFGCCTVGAPGIAFTSLLRANPSFFALIGDVGYPDKGSMYNPVAQNYAGYTESFARVLGHPRMAAITAAMPFFTVQDDHDYGHDDCDRTTAQAWAGSAFADLVPGGSFPAPNYRSWSVGDADFFLTDNRRWKDPESGPYENGRYMSVLGTTQRQWLLARLAASDAAVKFVFIPMTMAWFWSWAETKEVNDFITANVSGTVIFLSGDKHAGAVARSTPRIWEFLAAPLCNPTKHRTPSRSPAVIWTENGTGLALYNAYGLVDVDTLSAGTCTLRLMREDGVEMHRQTVALG
jgi:hypothetical protein